MAYLENLTTPATGDVAMRHLKTQLVASGWSVAASGDGRSAFEATGDAITADSGAGSLDASGAWMRLKMSGASREFLVIRGASSTTWTETTATRKTASVSVPGTARLYELRVRKSGGGASDYALFSSVSLTPGS